MRGERAGKDALKKDLSGMSAEEKLEKLEGATIGNTLESCNSGFGRILAWVG